MDSGPSLGNPIKLARTWATAGFRRLHVVDLDAAHGGGSNAALMEEIIFRGIFLRGFVARYGAGRGVVLGAALFGVAHFEPVKLPGTIVIGVLFGWWFVELRSIWPGVFGHALNNAIGELGVLSEPGTAQAAVPRFTWFEPVAAATGATMLAYGVVVLRRRFRGASARTCRRLSVRRHAAGDRVFCPLDVGLLNHWRHNETTRGGRSNDSESYREHGVGGRPRCDVASAAETKKASPRQIDISVTEAGVRARQCDREGGRGCDAGVHAKTDKTCATEVVVYVNDKEKVEKKLPLNQVVSVDAKFSQAGKLGYACGMNMHKGVIVIE
jgi:hypothetical protein